MQDSRRDEDPEGRDINELVAIERRRNTKAERSRGSGKILLLAAIVALLALGAGVWIAIS